MRVQNIQNAISVEYPDAIAYSGDRNTIKVSSLTSSPVGARFTFENGIGGSVTLEYQSENTVLVFNIWDTILALANGQNQNITVTGAVSNGGVSYNITAFSILIEQGRTLNDRPHHCVRTMYYMGESDLEKVNISVPVSGTLNVNNNMYPLVAGVNQIDLTADQYGTPITAPEGDFTGQVALSYSHSDEPVIFGDLWRHSDEPEMSYTLQFRQVAGGYGCSGGIYANYFRVRFLNIDGCWETFIGKITKQKRTVTYGEYVNGGLVKNTPMATVNGCKDEVTVLFDEIATDAYFTDIVFAKQIEYENGYGEWRNAILGTTNLTDEPKDGTSTFEVTLKILS